MTPRQIDALKAIAAGRMVPSLVKEDGAWYARWIGIDSPDNPWVDEYCRAALVTTLTANAEEQSHATLHDAWLAALRSRTGLVKWRPGECAAFAKVLDGWRERVMGDTAARGAIRFSFSGDDDGFAVSCARPSGYAQYVALGEAARFFMPLRHLRSSGDGTLSVRLGQGEANEFLTKGVRALREAGYTVDGAAPRAEITADAEIVDGKTRATAKAKLKIRIAGEVASEAEIRFLLDQGSSLVLFRNRWIEVDRSLLRQALRALEKTRKSEMTRFEAMSLVQGIGSVCGIQVAEAKAKGWLRGVIEDLRRRGDFSADTFRRDIDSAADPRFRGELRAYQSRGVAWLRLLADNGFGAILADDMGLGKTVQTIAWLCREKGPSIVVVPLSLISNWRHEIKSFAPSLNVYVHHGDRRHTASGFLKAASESDITLTSYALMTRDFDDISSVKWNCAVIDEAQTIKNPDTRVARAVKALSAYKRLALTGTPVENSAQDLWSIEEFLNPGFLPARKEFDEHYVRAVSNNPTCAEAKRLRHAMEPMMLRRLKSEPGIADELGEKREIREYCELDPGQMREYEDAVDYWRQSERERGDAFTLITRLKLVCDGFADGRHVVGGKITRLADLASSILQAGESLLVFTQYAKVGAAVQSALKERLGVEAQFLHGALSPRMREKEIAAFNSPGPKIFILSLKAGGLGLNLMKASHVVHYDRWWNPAVENQATDRAHRIGQRSTVFVHYLISPGTLEDHIDAMLVKKTAAAESLVTSGEKFLASLSGEEFERTVALEKGGE